MRVKKVNILITALVMLLAGLLPIMINAEGDPPVRAPDKYGHITSDETWSGDLHFHDIIIDEGVTVTVDPGANLYPYTDAYFWVQGTLIVNGTNSSPVTWGSYGGNEWKGLNVNTTGRLQMRNFSIYASSGASIFLGGLPSIMMDGYINGSLMGIASEQSSGHIIKNVTAEDAVYYGFVFDTNSNRIDIEGVTVHGMTLAGIALSGGHNNTISRAVVNHATYGIFLSDSKDILIDGVIINGYENTMTAGIYIINTAISTIIKNVNIRDVHYGIYFDPDIAEVIFDHIRTTSSVNTSIISSNPSDHISTSFIECHLDSAYKTADLNSPDPNTQLFFYNTSWNKNRQIDLGDNGSLLVSWYWDMAAFNGIGEPLDSTYRISLNTPGIPYNLDKPDGRLEKFRMLDTQYRGSDVSYVYQYAVKVDSNEYPGNNHMWQHLRATSYNYWPITLDLKPENDMPASLEVNEDEWLELDLYTHFSDPEGQDLSFDLQHSTNINLVQTGGPGSGDIRIKNAEPNWYGSGWVDITATDTGGNSTHRNVTVEVLPVDDAPMLTEDLPLLTVMEDSWTYYNFTGKVMDVEFESFSLTFAEGEDHTLEYNETLMNLTIWPAENFNGMLEIDINISDGDAWTHEVLMVNVTPVNDLPEASVMIGNISAGMAEYDLNETSIIMAYDLELEEDTMLEFWIQAFDVDSENLTYSFMEEDLMHGSIEVEVNQIEVIINETSNETEMQNITVPMNFTYTPDPDDDSGDLVKFMVSDGEGDVEFWAWFNVSSVNDPVQFTAPANWNISVDLDVMQTIDIAGWISDIDGDDISITTNSDHVIVNGTVLEILYNGSFMEASETVTVTVSDGTVQKTADLLVNINPPADDDDDDDDIEPSLGIPKVTGEEDKWVFEIDGTEGQDLWVVVEDDEGEKTSYKMTYDNGKYRAEVPKDDAEEGLSYHISQEDDGEAIDGSYDGTLPDLKEKETDGFPIWIVVLVIIIILLVVVIIALIMKGGGDEEYYDEE